MKYNPYSFSKLSTHDGCPRSFKYNYIDKAPKDQKDMTALLKGGAVHSILENYPDKSDHKLAVKYLSIAENFIKSNLGRKYFSVPSIREYDFGLTKELKPTSYNDKDALFRGSIDYICNIDDQLNLIDWKTGKMKEERYQNYNQLMFYAIYFFQKYNNIEKIKISYVYIEHDEENSLILDRKYLFNYISQLINLIKDTENDTVFEKHVTRLCEWCQYKSHCDKDI